MSWESYPTNADLLENQKKILELLQKIFESDDTTTNLLTKNEATEILGCKERTLRYYLYEDKSLKYLRIDQSIRIKKTEIYDKIVKHENKNLKNLLDEYGMNSKIIGYNEPFIVWFDKNVIISSVVSSHLVNNEQYKEKLISADTLLDGIIFTYTTYDDKGELGIDTKSHALDLIENANLLKNMN